jgi:DNA-binding NtrC family response regulator
MTWKDRDANGLRAIERQILGDSVAIRRLREQIYAQSQVPIWSLLVVGETGSGKGLVPRAILTASPHVRGPLEVVDCAAIPAGRLERELFGSWTGARAHPADRPPAVERAERGILFLDEIAAVPLEHQGKLLRLVENPDESALGAGRPHLAGPSVVASTHRDLAALVTRGQFREDLYYRLVQDGIIRVPPLRERLDDIPVLAPAFLVDLADSCGIAPDALTALRQFPWPGNVRQLRAVIRRAARTLAGSPLTARAVCEAYQQIAVPSTPAIDATRPQGGSFDRATSELRRRMLVEALAEADGNQTRAGLRLGFHLSRYGDSSTPELGARKLAHRKFRYWWERVVEANAERDARGVDCAYGAPHARHRPTASNAPDPEL